ncbi:glycosyl hydrolase family 62-domain-containing protein [Aspergillus sergii]|uniref:Alpha-L-arabinofuranosidase n=1 Tax=Aspergillus sergii TaxID=1034303 RepID=A0A5N6XCN4_9EURO|nr:glycosyl hydrolase family 62-domain-containing protein [Aspergillus sergii]
MLSSRLSVISVCLAAGNVLSASIWKDSVTKASLPKSFEWNSYDLAGIKDPSIIEVDGVYHVFASTAKEAGYNLVYLSFTDFNEANSATFHYLDQGPIGTGYRAAPRVFYFEPHKLCNPGGWSAPENSFDSMPSIISENIGNGNWVDMWTICDSSDCYLFSSDDNGHLYRSQSSLGNFPNGMGNTVIALQDTNAYALFEASNVYSAGDGEYLLLVKAIGSDGARYFRSWTSTSLSGTWASLADTEANPFARSNNIKFSAEAWN